MTVSEARAALTDVLDRVEWGEEVTLTPPRPARGRRGPAGRLAQPPGSAGAPRGRAGPGGARASPGRGRAPAVPRRPGGRRGGVRRSRVRARDDVAALTALLGRLDLGPSMRRSPRSPGTSGPPTGCVRPTPSISRPPSWRAPIASSRATGGTLPDDQGDRGDLPGRPVIGLAGPSTSSPTRGLSPRSGDHSCPSVSRSGATRADEHGRRPAASSSSSGRRRTRRRARLDRRHTSSLRNPPPCTHATARDGTPSHPGTSGTC